MAYNLPRRQIMKLSHPTVPQSQLQIVPTTQDITVAINDINEKPIITSGSTYSVDENQTAIGSITATDESSDLIYELTGTDAQVLTLIYQEL